jgi:hypothetical protein
LTSFIAAAILPSYPASESDADLRLTMVPSA